jgi:hypothetical protein
MKIPRILLRSNGARPLVLAELGAPTRVADLQAIARSVLKADATAEVASSSFRALGYRQTLLPAAKGGKVLNSQGWRFRNAGMRALARSFRGKVFIGAHDWGDPKARGGDIVDAYAEEIENDTEIAIFYDIVAKAPWAIEGLANKTIDRFSLGVDPKGEITCTVHDVPVWSTDDCYCWPGQTVEDGLVAEWEFEDGEGLELSAVNVPAVEGTGIVEASADADAGSYAALAALCGRESVRARNALGGGSKGGARVGGFRREPAPITMAVSNDSPRGALMDRALLCQKLGLPATATDEQILARIAENATAAAQAGVLQTQLAEVANREQQLAAERDAAHVESEITRLRASRAVSDAVVEKLRATAKSSRSAFDASLALVESSAPELVASATGGAPTTARPVLQSDGKPAQNPGVAVDALEDGPDAFEANRTNPNLGKLMKLAGVTAEDVRKHGSRSFHVLPNLRELADATAAR